MSSVDRLALYNASLRICGERKLGSLTENREPRRLLDDVWDNNALMFCLEQGLWHFAMRSVRLDADPDVTPAFGNANAFQKPSDWVRTAGVYQDEFCKIPLTDYLFEGGYFYAPITPIYLRYVSNDESYGADYSLWPQTFAQYVQGYLAGEIIAKLTADQNRVKEVKAIAAKLLLDAKSKSAMAESVQFAPPGSWTMARRYGTRLTSDRGSFASGSLTTSPSSTVTGSSNSIEGAP
jgi:hypothetical protein